MLSVVSMFLCMFGCYAVQCCGIVEAAASVCVSVRSMPRLSLYTVVVDDVICEGCLVRVSRQK